MLLQILEITTPVFVLACIGYGWTRTGLPFDIPFVTRLAMQVSIPCLIFSVLSGIEVDPVLFRDLALASLVLYVAIAACAWMLVRGGGLDRRAYLAPLIFGNTGNIGLPIAFFAYGDEGLAYAMVVFAVMASLSFTAGLMMVTEKASPLEALKQPIFYASILGILFTAQGWPVPDVVNNTLSLVGQIAIPTMLITVGVAVAQLDVRDLGRALAVSIAKLTLCAIAAVAVAAAFQLDAVPTGALILQAIMPVAVTSYMLATRYDADPDSVAGLVVVSTIVSIAAIPVALAILL
jgi:predicted permease